MSHEFEKTYWAICRGWPDEAFTVDHDLDGGPGKPVKKPAVTAFRRLATVELDEPSTGFPTSRYAWLEAMPRTGRFRQIRRHLKHVSHQLIGDTSHGDGRHNRAFRMRGIHRMLLHARAIEFPHPSTGTRLRVAGAGGCGIRQGAGAVRCRAHRPCDASPRATRSAPFKAVRTPPVR